MAIDDLVGAFDEGADSDEIHAKKGGKNKNRGDKQGKKQKGKKGKAQESEEEEDQKQEEEKIVHEDEDVKEEVKEDELPLGTIYCQSK